MAHPTLSDQAVRFPHKKTSTWNSSYSPSAGIGAAFYTRAIYMSNSRLRLLVTVLGIRMFSKIGLPKDPDLVYVR